MRLTGPLIAANARRAADGAAATVAATRTALDTLEPRLADIPGHLVAAARLRIEHPTDSLPELAERCNLTKDAFAGRLRRLIALAGRAR